MTRDSLARLAGVVRRKPTGTPDHPPFDTASLVWTAERSVDDPAALRTANRDVHLAGAVAATDDAWLAARGAAVLCVMDRADSTGLNGEHVAVPE